MTEYKQIAQTETHDRSTVKRAAARMSVVVATCNRHAHVVKAIRSILEIEHDFELIIVDQSDGESTSVFDDILADPRATYHKMNRKGLSIARNEGIRLCRGEFIAMTDDDCEVPWNWLQSFSEVFEQHEQVAMIFGNVRPGLIDQSQGFIPAHVRSQSFLGRHASHKNQIEGMGACMAVRRKCWELLGGFDEMLGAGARFPAAEEGDFALRALRAGLHVYETPGIELTHHGFRTWEQGQKLIPNYWYGTGAMFAKNWKLSPVSTTRLLAGLGSRWLLGRSSLTAKSLGHIATSKAKLGAFTRGFFAGLCYKVNRKSQCFQ